MAKRRSVRQLNKDEPDDVDDDPEQSGTYEMADQREIAERKIKTAKRRMPAGDDNDRPKPLANFAGFSTAAAGSPFQFFQKLASNAEKSAEPPAAAATVTSSVVSGSENLKNLNMSFLNWIKDQLAKDAVVVLTPVFRDYEKHLDSLKLGEAEAGSSAGSNNWKFGPSASASASASASVDNALNASKEGQSKVFTFDRPSSSSDSKPAASTAPFAGFADKNVTSSSPSIGGKSAPSFGLGEVKAVPAPTFNFGQVKTSTSAPSFSFGEKKSDAPSVGLNGSAPAVPSFLANLAAASAAAKQNAAPQEGEDESDEPPVSDFVPVGEDGSVFDIRCKLFVKKDGQFNSIGVGKLYLKPLPSGKTQAIARADTAQGSVLLNVILTADMPLQKTGKNNVLIVCVPTPEAKPPPVPVLIRVKGADERDELFSKIDALRSSK